MVDYEHQGGSMCIFYIQSVGVIDEAILPLEVAKSKTKADSYHTPFVSSTVFDKYTQICSLLFLSVFIPSVFVFMLKKK